MGWLNFGGKKRDRAQGFGDSSKTKSRKRPKSFILERIVTPSAGFGDWEHEFDHLHQLLGSFSLSDLHLPNFLADSGVCPIDPSGPTNNLPPLIDFDPLGLYHDGIATQTPYTPGGAFETLPIALIPVDPQSPNPSNPNAIRQLLNFPLASQPYVGSIDTGVSADSPYLNYANIKKGRDYVGGDDNPLLKAGEGSEHGTFMLGIVDAINKTAPKWVGRAIDSGRWADSLVEFVDAAKASGQKNAIANLSLDLTQKNADGSVTTRYELTPAERSAIEYARQNGVMLVVAAGNDGGVMSVLGQASQEFDNIFTVGAGDINGRSIYSSYGRGLDIVADGGTTEHPDLSTVGNDLGTMAGTSVATAKVAGAASLVWAANPALNYRQVMEILKSTARDLGPVGWDDETGFGFLNTLAAVDLAKKTKPEVYRPTPWVTPGTWSGEGKVTPEERAAKGENSIAAATVQVSTNFSDSDRVDSNQPEKYYQFTVTEPGYVSWNLTSLNPVSGFPTPPQVTVTKADGKPGSHTFFKGASLQTSVVGEGQTSFQGGNFYDPGTYYLKVGNGAGSSFNDYNISTQFISDKVSSFTGNIQYRTQPYYSLENSLQSAVFSGPAVSELSNLSGVVTYDNIQFNNRIAKYGMEVNESGKIRINLNSPNGKMEVSVKKFIGSDDRPESIASLEVSANSDGWLELDLNKGRYDIEVKTPSNFWLEPDWNWTQEKLVRPYTLNATFAPNAPQPGQGKVPSSAGAFDKTVVSNGVVNHYYKNGYLTVQPSGQASWYGYPLGVVSISAQPLNDPVPLADPDGNYSIQTAANVLLPSGGADLGNGVNSDRVEIGYILSSIGGKDLNDFYKFSFDSLKLVNFYLSQSGTAAQWWLLQDRNGNGQVDPGEAIKTGTLTTKPLDLDVILGAGDYYLQVGSLSSDATSVYAVNVAARSLENQVIASYNSDYYLVQNGQLRLIPNQETLNALKINPNTVKRFSNEDLALIPTGQELPSRKDGSLLSISGGGKVYQMQSGKRRWIPDAETFNAMGLDWSNIKYFPIEDVDTVPLGEELPSRKDGSLLSINTGGKVYQMQSGKRRWIPDAETFNAMGLDWSNIKYFPIEDVNIVPLGEDLPSRKSGSGQVRPETLALIEKYDRVYSNNPPQQGHTGDVFTGTNYLSLKGSPEFSEMWGKLFETTTQPNSDGGYLDHYYIPGNPVQNNTYHAGIDFGVPSDTPVKALVGGEVVYVGTWDGKKTSSSNPMYSGEWGTIAIYNATLKQTFMYLHMGTSQFSEGDVIQAGTVIGTSGSTGAASPHLHLEVKPTPSKPNGLTVKGLVPQDRKNWQTVEELTDNPLTAYLAARDKGLTEGGGTVVNPPPGNSGNSSSGSKGAKIINRSPHIPDWEKPAFIEGLNQISDALGINRDYLPIIMVTETGVDGEINPAAGWGGDQGCGGLIQFCAWGGANEVGKTPTQIRAMSATEQLPLVRQYLQTKNIPTGADLATSYLSILYPASMNAPRGQSLPIPGQQAAYLYNSNGTITKESLEAGLLYKANV